MKYIYFLLPLSLILSGCATKKVYMNTSRTSEEIQKDTDSCQAEVDKSDFKDPALKQNKLNQCMEKKGYKAVSQEEAEKIQGFQGLWINPNTNFKNYEVIFIDRVGVSETKEKETQLPSAKVSEEDLHNLAGEMSQRFAKTIGTLIPVVTDEKQISGRKALCLRLKLTEVGQTDVLLNAASEAIPVDLPIGSEGLLAFKGEITDFSTGEKLIAIEDNAAEDKNASLIGHENFSAWNHAYNIMDYWADHLAALLAKVRNQEYKSRLGIKIF